MRGLRAPKDGRKKRLCYHDLLGSPGMGAQSVDNLQRIVCYRSGDETVELGLKDRRVRSNDHLSAFWAYLLPWTEFSCESW